jgi:glycosidase
MTIWPRFPLYEINTRVWLAEPLQCGRRLLADADQEFRKWATFIDAIWLMGCGPSEYSRELALNDQELTAAFSKVLPDWKPEDVASSPYSVLDYRVDENLGGNAGLARFREKLKDHSTKLLLDFVPNHTAVEHPWVTTNPDFYINIPENVMDRVGREDYFITQDNRQIACGRVLQAPSWKDTLQLNYANPNLRQALIDTLHTIALLCDGVRCDTAITGLREVFRRTWGELGCQMETEFWDRAIADVKKTSPDFLFIAEIYGEFEWQLQQLGFDFPMTSCFTTNWWDVTLPPPNSTCGQNGISRANSLVLPKIMTGRVLPRFLGLTTRQRRF